MPDNWHMLSGSPVGRTFLYLADKSGLSLEDCTQAHVGFALAAAAVDAMEPWSSDPAEILQRVDESGVRFAALASQLGALEGTDWWFSDVNRQEQVHVERLGGALSPVVPEGVEDRDWPSGAFVTSTRVSGLDNFTIALLRLTPLSPPLAARRFAVEETARVFEVHSPQDWHRLCVEAPYPRESAPRMRDEGPGTLVPDWALVAEQWDGVHVSFGGLLSSAYVESVSVAARTALRSWPSEATVWFQDVLVPLETLVIQKSDLAGLFEVPWASLSPLMDGWHKVHNPGDVS